MAVSEKPATASPAEVSPAHVTHEVFNQPPPYEGVDLFTADRVLVEAGRRVDEVEFHPAWHALLRLGVENGLHALPWREPRPGAHVARAALFMLLAEAEAGVGCPLSMTFSAVPALRHQPELAAEWEPRLTALGYEPRLLPFWEKPGALCGMARLGRTSQRFLNGRHYRSKTDERETELNRDRITGWAARSRP